MTRTLLRNANLLDGERPARANVTVVIEGERIVAVSGPGDAPVEPASPRDRDVDLAGRTLLPGLPARPRRCSPSGSRQTSHRLTG